MTQAKFGLLFSRTIVGSSYGQPLYVGGVTVNGAKHNVVYVATEHNMVYAFDADSAAASAPLWSKMLPSPLTLGGGGYDPGCADMHDEVGITSTPVISAADNRIYVVAKVPGGQETPCARSRRPAPTRKGRLQPLERAPLASIRIFT